MTDKLKDRIRTRWNAFQPTKIGTFWALVYIMGGTLVLGFTAGGWMTAGSANEMAEKAANDARAQLAGSVCVERFLAAENADVQLAEFKSIDYGYKRREFVEQGGWAMMPGHTPAGAVSAANHCANALHEQEDVVAAGSEKAEG